MEPALWLNIQCQGCEHYERQHWCDWIIEATMSEQPSVCAARQLSSLGRVAFLQFLRLGSLTTFLASSTKATVEESNGVLSTRFGTLSR